MNRFPREEIHRKVYLFGLAMLLCCLPLSRYLVSVAQFLITLNWIAEGHFRNRLHQLRNRPAILVFASVFVMYALGLLYSADFHMGLEKVKNALPLLFLPLVMGTSPALAGKALKRLLLLFTAAVITASLVCIIGYMVRGLPPGGDFRDISVFMTHIRFALLIDMAIAILLYFAFFEDSEGNTKNHFKDPEFWLTFACAIYLAGFQLFLRSATGILILLLLVAVIAVNIIIRFRKPLRHIGLGMIAGLFLAGAALVLFTWFRNFHVSPVDPGTLESNTVNGNPYVHDTLSGMLENGHYTELYLCEPELRKEWNRISDMPYDQFDLKGQPINATIRRYLTSMGLRKDSAGLHSLTPADLEQIEKGYANYKFRENPGIYQRLYETLWEIHVFQRSGYAEQHSFGQRLLFTRLAGELIREHPWTGYGPGDVYRVMLDRAIADNFSIDPKWEGKPHNQFAFLLLGFGIAGFLLILGCWIFPVIRMRAWRYLLFNLFVIIISVSMLVMDTLESYDSMAFFGFFYCLFVFAAQKKPDAS
jgi:O-antigen ligase